jgi:metal-dependent amidase/aminoacylase/carboxypeptidase family protein
MAAEDFGFFAREVPSAFLWLGQGGRPEPGGDAGTGSDAGALGAKLSTARGLHHPCFAVDESVLATGAALHAHLAAQSLLDLRP